MLFTFFYFAEQCKFVEGHKRRECGFAGMSSQDCLDKGCCWSPLESSSKHPWCHHSEGTFHQRISLWIMIMWKFR